MKEPSISSEVLNSFARCSTQQSWFSKLLSERSRVRRELPTSLTHMGHSGHWRSGQLPATVSITTEPYLEEGLELVHTASKFPEDSLLWRLGHIRKMFTSRRKYTAVSSQGGSIPQSLVKAEVYRSL
ncbi:hypothetical protein RRG08_019469 [Elysia crispata]|uniref:Uncharacterized protein n=1 Tax=Elysia crispata TaxID=231223 RepID=A0AAE1A4W0_9GAST|nr:hypothetical protein RRG08_019469 [Elysia crispata]